MTNKRKRFVDEYLVDLNATKAAERSGYSAKTAYSQGQRLLKDVDISAEIAARQQKLAEKAGITQEWVIEQLRLNYARAMEAQPVVDREGKPTGEFTYQGSVANKALELLGKHLGMFADRKEHGALTTLEALVAGAYAKAMADRDMMQKGPQLVPDDALRA